MRNTGNHNGRDGVRLLFRQGLQQSKTDFTAKVAEKNRGTEKNRLAAIERKDRKGLQIVAVFVGANGCSLNRVGQYPTPKQLFSSHLDCKWE